MGSQHQQFCLRWSNHQSNMLSVFDDLLQHEALVDVTIACDGLSVKAHKVVLSACSPFFQHLFLENPCQHPIVILKDTKYAELKALVDFMYKGEVNVTQEQLTNLLKTAETLKIKGLAEVTGGMNGQQRQQERDNDGDRLNTPPPPLERPNQHRTLTTTSLSPPLPPLPPSIPTSLQSPSKSVASSLSIMIPPFSSPSETTTTTTTTSMPTSRSPNSPPLSKRKKTRHRRRSPDDRRTDPGSCIAGVDDSIPRRITVQDEDDCRLQMHGSPEMIEAKVEMTSPDEDFEDVGEGVRSLRRRHRLRRSVTDRRISAQIQQEHGNDDGTRLKMLRLQQLDPQTDSNQESLMENLYVGTSSGQSEQYMSVGESSVAHLLPKIKSPIPLPSTSSQGDPSSLTEGGVQLQHGGGDRGSAGYIPKRGQPRILNEEEEILIVTYIVDMAAKGRPVTRRCVLEYGNTLLRREDRIPTGSIHCNPEKGLSNDWWKEFKKRHPGLPVRAPTSSSSSSSSQMMSSSVGGSSSGAIVGVGIGVGGASGEWSRMVEDSESDCPKDQ